MQPIKTKKCISLNADTDLNLVLTKVILVPGDINKQKEYNCSDLLLFLNFQAL